MPKNVVTVHLFTEKEARYFEGKILTLIETLGLADKQEKATKDSFRDRFWSFWENPWGVEEKTQEFHD